MARFLGNAERAALPEAGAALTGVVWTEPALRHLEAIRTYIAQFNPLAARDVAAGLKALGDNLNHLPQRGRPVRGTNLRELIVCGRLPAYRRACPEPLDGSVSASGRMSHVGRAYCP